MSGADAAVPPDEGLFLRHLNRGKHLHNTGRFAEAEKQLEEACLLRPRDLKVLNLLGLSYFKQEKYEKAEEVYRKLVAENPGAHTLHYNLGLIYLKLARLNEAEQSLLRAQQISGNNPKISFYLGTIYERMGRLQDSIYQYRHGGAHLMARRLQEQMETPVPSEDAPEDDADETEPRHAADDTAELNADYDQLVRGNTQPFIDGDKRVRPVSPTLLAQDAADGAAAVRAFRAGAPSRSAPRTIPSMQSPDIVSILAATPPEPIGAKLTDTFRLLRAGLLEVGFSGKAFVKQGTVYSYTGNLTFWVKDKRPGGRPALVIVSGKGRVVLTDRERDVTLLTVADEPVYVEPDHVLACEESLTPRYVKIDETSEEALEFLTFEGRGTLALCVARRPLTMGVTPEMPVSVPAASVIAWSGSLSARLAENRAQVEPLLFSPGRGTSLLRLEGTGQVLVEQVP